MPPRLLARTRTLQPLSPPRRRAQDLILPPIHSSRCTCQRVWVPPSRVIGGEDADAKELAGLKAAISGSLVPFNN
eukprot:5158077-Prorocentrum_lima.AAC.1